MASVKAIDMSSTVVPFGDVALKACIVERVILHLYGQPLDLRIEARPLGHCPAFQYSADLQAKIEMPAPSMMKLHHENRLLWHAFGRLATRLGGMGEIALALIIAKTHESSCLPCRRYARA